MALSPTAIARSLATALKPSWDQDSGWQTGTIAAVDMTGNYTVDVYLDNSATGAGASITPGLPYMSYYYPAVGDAVLIARGQGSGRTSRMVMGPAAGSAGAGGSGVPIGAILLFPKSFSSPVFILCDGTNYPSLATTNPALYAYLGNSTTVPDMRNVFPMGAGSTVALGATTGATTATISTSNMPSHTHSMTHTHSHNHGGHTHGTASGGSSHFVLDNAGGAVFTTGGSGFALNGTSTITASTTPTTDSSASSASSTGSAGSGSAFSVLNPARGVAWYIKSA